MTQHQTSRRNNHVPTFTGGACSDSEHDPEWWFPLEVRGEGQYRSYLQLDTPNVEKARAICSTCPVKQECSDWSMQYSGLFGIWGGLDSQQRMMYQRRNGLAPLIPWTDTYVASAWRSDDE